ncbi:MAG TPA: 4-hydroxy-tetrahydrodipicolinate reductase, partial [Actinobacteria bacterium]|nr:4-hydroxy-tetrahydrodipicolinate reductase [Actinomycetota bacterium]
MITVLVSGAAGRMGSEVVRAVSAEDDLRLVAAVDPAHAGEPVQDSPGLAYAGDLAETLEATRPDVMVDFTHPSVVAGNIETALTRGIHCVVGTT